MESFITGETMYNAVSVLHSSWANLDRSEDCTWQCARYLKADPLNSFMIAEHQHDYAFAQEGKAAATVGLIKTVATTICL